MSNIDTLRVPSNSKAKSLVEGQLAKGQSLKNSKSMGEQNLSNTSSLEAESFDTQSEALASSTDFLKRHIGPSKEDLAKMLEFLKIKSMDELVDESLPEAIYPNFCLPPPLSETELLKEAKVKATKNKLFKSYIGMGYKPSITPSVLQRNILENPVWYTPYTPYQAELAQGRLSALLNFQTMVADLTGMEIANSSLLDEGTALAEGLSLAKNANEKKASAKKFFVDARLFPQSLEVLNTRSKALGLEMEIGQWENFKGGEDYFAAILQYPDSEGRIPHIESFLKAMSKDATLSLVATDLLSLLLLKPPGEMGADIVVGSSQNFGIPMFFGGPHAAFFATRKEFIRLVPGRIVGVSRDRQGRTALRLSLQTREQHIRREKATSNICTSQALLAVMAGFYAIYHGPEGLKQIALKIHRLTQRLFKSLASFKEIKLLHRNFFDTLMWDMPSKEEALSLYKVFQREGINIGFHGDRRLSITLHERASEEDLLEIQKILSKNFSKLTLAEESPPPLSIPKELLRQSSCLKQAVFNSFHSETEILRYIHRLQSQELSLAHSMIPLGSCSMKLNACSELLPISWRAFSDIHPFAPLDQTQGWRELIHELEAFLCELTGFKAFSFQANAGSQGEYAGLLAIREYHASKGDIQRTICLIPSSAHGTNPASAVMAGLRPIPIRCKKDGTLDEQDLDEKLKSYQNQLAGIMITYPSTYGFFEEGIRDVLNKVHQAGGLVYWDGANMNAMMGLCRPADMGFDLGHLNLHKSFCIPHGGGGPGAGPLGVSEKLKAFLPQHVFGAAQPAKDRPAEALPVVGAISSAPFGSAGILPIAWAYIRLMGLRGLKKSSMTAITSANYMAEKLRPYYRILFSGKKKGRVAHECIIDLRKFKIHAGISVEDVAKRLMDYSLHAPTMSWPEPGTLMMEPTESESKKELDRFCSALIAIREEIRQAEKNPAMRELLKAAPHCLEDLLSDKWPRPYSKKQAFYPLPWLRERKFHLPVSRIDNAFGDINPVCSCPPWAEEDE